MAEQQHRCRRRYLFVFPEHGVIAWLTGRGAAELQDELEGATDG